MLRRIRPHHGFLILLELARLNFLLPLRYLLAMLSFLLVLRIGCVVASHIIDVVNALIADS